MGDEKKTTSKEKERTIRWEVQEFKYIEKTNDWYWIVGALGVALSVIAYLVGNWSFSIVVLLSTGLLMYMAGHKPRMLEVTINSRTLHVNGKRYSMKDYETYKIDEERNKLLLKSKKAYLPLTVIPMPTGHSSDKLITLLEEKIKLEEDEELNEPFLEVVMHRLGF